MKRKFFILSIFVGLHFAAFAQEIRQYEVLVAGIKIGDMVAKKSTEKDMVQYEIKSQVSFWFFGKINLSYHTLSKYKDGMLVSSDVKSTTNKGNFESSVKWKGKYYDVDANSYKYENKEKIDRPFYCSAAVLFFDEPVKHLEMIAETYGTPTKINRKKGYYEVVVNGDTNQYHFVDGKMVKAVMEFPIKNYVLKLKE
ncbi:DUF6134 family protein [Mariniradius sediminis]|jgi:hypothetical protein|uniref:Uncharacterized protein n=1 Tax=Mariniradius sediminis TaxID=2909237 RepID=A0ABS9BXG7_9BACT|nr:DUF6134 family protein [Mariniradius sediminis]MCF1752688.1 hypothetical protein [Mariniradius sediminis]